MLNLATAIINNDSINVRPAHPPGICREFFFISFPTVRNFPEVSPGMGHYKKQLGLSDYKSSMWFRFIMYNICKLFPLTDGKMTERRTCTICERVAVLAVKKRFELLQILWNTFICERLLLSCSVGWSFGLFQKPHRGAFVRVSWPHRGAFATILKSKDKCPRGWDDRAWNWSSYTRAIRPFVFRRTTGCCWLVRLQCKY